MMSNFTTGVFATAFYFLTFDSSDIDGFDFFKLNYSTRWYIPCPYYFRLETVLLMLIPLINQL